MLDNVSSIVLDDRSAARLEDTELTSGAYYGLLAKSGVSLSLRGCTLTGNLWGLSAGVMDVTTRRAVLAARDFHQTHVPAVPFEVIREFLQKTNAAWLARERSHCARLHAAFQARIDDMFRKTQHGMPYDKVVAHRENAKLRDELKKARAKHLKGRPKKPVSRKFPDAPRRWFSDMRSAARDELRSVPGCERAAHWRGAGAPRDVACVPCRWEF